MNPIVLVQEKHLWCKYTKNTFYFQTKAEKTSMSAKNIKHPLEKVAENNVIPLFRFVFFCAFLIYFPFLL